MLNELLALTDIAPRTKRHQEAVLDSVERYARQQLVPFNLCFAVQGIRYGISTGRLTANAEATVKGLSPYRLVKLLAEMSEAGLMQVDVPRFLNQKFS